MRIKYCIPKWLDDYIFSGLGAQNSPDFNKAQYNLDADKDAAIQYLGTYFPRSFVESYSIFENLFAVPNYNRMISQKRDLNILSFGSGSGGDVIGLLQALNIFGQVKNIKILALDGNLDNLRLLKQIIKLNEITQRFNIVFEEIPFAIQSLNDLDEYCNHIPVHYDFITSFKFVNELYSSNILGNDCYELLAQKLMTKLTDTGIFLLLDVNICIRGTYMSNLMRSNLSHFMTTNLEYKTLSPIPCHFYINCNNAKCWPKIKISTITSKGTYDECISYRLMGRASFVDNVYQAPKYHSYFVQKERSCAMFQHNGVPKLGFDLNN